MSSKMNQKAMVRRPRQNSRKPNGNARRSGAVIPKPPQINGYEITHSKTLRFGPSVGGAYNVTFQNLLDTITFAASATQLYDVFYAVKVRRVRIWALPSLTAPSSALVVFTGNTAGFVGDRDVHQDSSMGIEPAYVDARPKKTSLASMYQTSSSAIAMHLDCPTGSIIDVDLDFRGDVLNQSVGAQFNSVAATAGATCFRGLDGVAKAATSLPAISSVNTV